MSRMGNSMGNSMGSQMSNPANAGCGCGSSRQPMPPRTARMPYAAMDRKNNDMRDNAGCGCDQRRAMMNVYELGFIMVEIVLYLDTHPEDAEALDYYCTMKEKYHDAVQFYTDNFGPLLANHVECGNYWTWASTPLPWEMEG